MLKDSSYHLKQSGSYPARQHRGLVQVLCGLNKKLLLADAHGEVKVNAWEAPTQISAWKEEHVRPKLCLQVIDPSLECVLHSSLAMCMWQP